MTAAGSWPAHYPSRRRDYPGLSRASIWDSGGKFADLLVLGFDPLGDGFKGFSNPEQNILAVMKAGKFSKSSLQPDAR